MKKNNTTTIGNMEITKGKTDFTTVSDLGKVIVSNFADGNFNSAELKYPLQKERASLKRDIKKLEETLEILTKAKESKEPKEDVKKIQDEIEEKQAQVDAISLKLKEIGSYKFQATDLDKASYSAYAEFMKQGTEETQEQFASKLSDLFNSLGLELTNGALVNILQRVGMRKATIRQMATERTLIKVAPRGQFYHQVYAFLAEGLDMIGLKEEEIKEKVEETKETKEEKSA